MADNDNKDLMQFLEKKFDGIEKRFNGIEKQFEGINKRLDNTPTKDELEAKITAAKEETMRHTGVLIENLDHKIDIVIEGLMTVNQKLDRHMEENEKEHARLERAILVNAADISKLDQRVGKLEGRV